MRSGNSVLVPIKIYNGLWNELNWIERARIFGQINIHTVIERQGKYDEYRHIYKNEYEYEMIKGSSTMIKI